MRLVCPNCEAKYEVPDDAIPDTGRDVQCTNCGHTWFQMRGRAGAAPLVAAVEPTAKPDASPEPASAQEPAGEPEAEPVDPPASVARADDGEVGTEPVDLVEAEAAEAPAVAEVVVEAERGDEAAVALDPSDLPDVSTEVMNPAEAVTLDSAEPPSAADLDQTAPVAVSAEAALPSDFLQEDEPEEEIGAPSAAMADTAIETPEAAAEAMAEAVSGAEAGPAAFQASSYAVDDSVLAILREEAEREANARRAEVLESQTDLGIDSAMPRKDRPVAGIEAKPAARRDLLPDVEEINSTLRPSEMQDGADAPDFVALPPEAPRGFRSGFLSLMTVAILAAALYLVAPRLAVMVPSLAGPLETYVSMIDSLRLGLDGVMRSATVAISDG